MGSAFVTLGSNASSLAGVGSLIVYNIVNPLENCKTRVTNAVAGIMSTISSAANSNSGTAVSYTHLDVYKRQENNYG